MAKIKLTKGELKRQRDALAQYKRYLPTLQLKKQQLQLEILRKHRALLETENKEKSETESALRWCGIFAGFNIRDLLGKKSVTTRAENIAGVELTLFERVEFEREEYDIFITPFWVDSALEDLEAIISLNEEMKMLKIAISALKQELAITTQRVNLFEKVKIPESEEAIRRIKIYIGDQLANAVGRSKIAKRKIEAVLAGGLA